MILAPRGPGGIERRIGDDQRGEGGVEGRFGTKRGSPVDDGDVASIIDQQVSASEGESGVQLGGAIWIITATRPS